MRVILPVVLHMGKIYAQIKLVHVLHSVWVHKKLQISKSL